jgi:hypothetical protein
MTRCIRLSLSLALLVVACTGNSDRQSDTAIIAQRPDVRVTPRVDTNRITGSTPPVIPLQSSTPSRATVAAWTVNEFGLGALRAGMTVAEAAKAVGGSFSARPGEAKTCGYAVWPEAPPNVLVMLDEGRVARVDIVRDSRIPTSKGARIGDTEARIKELYKGRVAVTPHEYTDGHYLTVTPEPGNAEARNNRLVFETDGNRVLRYHGGKLPQVAYVEGCS